MQKLIQEPARMECRLGHVPFVQEWAEAAAQEWASVRKKQGNGVTTNAQ